MSTTKTEKPARVWWDECTSSVSRRSNRWAATDRGWLFRDGEKNSLGHYLDYASVTPVERRSPSGTVHAVVVGGESRYCRDVAEAKRFIERAHGLGEQPSNPRSRIAPRAKKTAEREGRVR